MLCGLFTSLLESLLDQLSAIGTSLLAMAPMKAAMKAMNCPVIPMVLVNGVEGIEFPIRSTPFTKTIIGRGWSSSVSNFNPRDIISNLRFLAGCGTLLDIGVHLTSLEQMVTEGLMSLGWTCYDQIWSHARYPDGFKIDDMVDDKLWAMVRHQIRETYRLLSFEKLKNSGRHDAACIGPLPYLESRRKLAIQWAGANFTANMLVLGGIASPYQRSRNYSTLPKMRIGRTRLGAFMEVLHWPFS